MATDTVSPLRQRMIEDMNSRKLCAHTQRGHIHNCKRLAAFLKRSSVSPFDHLDSARYAPFDTLRRPAHLKHLTFQTSRFARKGRNGVTAVNLLHILGVTGSIGVTPKSSNELHFVTPLHVDSRL